MNPHPIPYPLNTHDCDWKMAVAILNGRTITTYEPCPKDAFQSGDPIDDLDRWENEGGCPRDH